ncbi:Hypothetical_protein [Hexamita inflata]|uniref:Hypothetical_protein n=1 Tax=Hexamita inflata TaxID=28002 RepID=A0ABP1H4D0_9EUKA
MSCVNSDVYLYKSDCENNAVGTGLYCILKEGLYCSSSQIRYYVDDTIGCIGEFFRSFSACQSYHFDCEFIEELYYQSLTEIPIDNPVDPVDIMSIAIGAGVGGGILIVIAIVIGLVCSRCKKLGTAPTYVQQQQSVMYPTGVQNNVYQQQNQQPQQYDYSQPQPIQQAQPVQQQLYIAQPQEQAFDQQQLYGMPQSSINVQKSNATVSIDWQAVM